MFTIKHVAENGDEFLVECDRFVREQRSDGFVQYTAHHKPPCDNFDYVASWCGDERAAFGPGSPGIYQRLYVMNRFGSTVAVHTFGKPDFSVVREGPMQGDPALAEAA